MRTRALLSAGIVGAMLGLGCSKSEPAETVPEQSVREAADTTTVGAGAAEDSVTAAEGAYRDSAAVAGDSAAAEAVGDTAAAEAPDTSGLTPDTTGFGAGADSVRSDSM